MVSISRKLSSQTVSGDFEFGTEAVAGPGSIGLDAGLPDAFEIPVKLYRPLVEIARRDGDERRHVQVASLLTVGGYL